MLKEKDFTTEGRGVLVHFYILFNLSTYFIGWLMSEPFQICEIAKVYQESYSWQGTDSTGQTSAVPTVSPEDGFTRVSTSKSRDFSWLSSWCTCGWHLVGGWGASLLNVSESRMNKGVEVGRTQRFKELFKEWLWEEWVIMMGKETANETERLNPTH